MQGARRAHVHWPIFNRRATPQDGMDRFPNADVFLEQDTSSGHARRRNSGMKLPGHKTKIVCTIGPASSSESVIARLVKGGMNVARLNLSHGTLEDHTERMRTIRSVAARLNRPVTVLLDLPGPKIRVGKLKDEPVTLKRGTAVTLTTRKVLGTASQIPVSYERLPESVSKGSTVYLNDGMIQLRVRRVLHDEVTCVVSVGGQLRSFKGLNLPKAKLFVDSVTERDLAFVDFGLENGVDMYCASFVTGPDDIAKVKDHAGKRGKTVYVVAKIERAEAVKNIERILEVADAIMVARGDLGVQTAIEDIPAVQKLLIRKANLRSRPVITATQMLESMMGNTRPTRAEVTDVANAILDGTDAVMLSEETALGAYPVEAVRMMVRIAASIERHRSRAAFPPRLRDEVISRETGKGASLEDVISVSVVDAVHASGARFILTPTTTGSTPCRISRLKPGCWILAPTTDSGTHELLALSYGVHPVLIKDMVDTWEAIALRLAAELNLARTGDRVVLTEGGSTQQLAGTNSLKILTLP
jgi:pyruvate kinase